MNIETLIRLQAGFDESRGFANLPEASASLPTDVIARLEFSLIGLTGEVGEIANIIKKARRSLATGTTEDDLRMLPEEAADVLSYLLKIAGQARFDLTFAYLTKMCLNSHRFHPATNGSSRTVTLCGPPGSGKSTIAARIGSAMRPSSVYLERHEENPFLRDLQSPPADFDAERSQAWFLDRMADFLATSAVGPLLLDQDPTAIPLIYGSHLAERGVLNRGALDGQLGELLRLEIEQVDKLAGRTVILLDAPGSVLAARCKEKVGGQLDADLLDELRSDFLRTFGGLRNVRRIDADRPLEDVLAEVEAVFTSATRSGPEHHARKT